MREKATISKTSEVTYQVDKDGTYKLVSSYGDENYKLQIEQVLKTIPNEWVLLRDDSTKKLQLISKIEVTEESFSRFKSTLSYRVVE